MISEFFDIHFLVQNFIVFSTVGLMCATHFYWTKPFWSQAPLIHLLNHKTPITFYGFLPQEKLPYLLPDIIDHELLSLQLQNLLF